MYSKSEDWSGSCASMQFRSSKCSKCLFANEMESLGVEKCGSNIIGVLVMVCHYKNDVHWLLQMKTFESNEIRFRSFSPRRLASLSISLDFSVLLKDRLQISSRLFGNIWRSFLPTIEQTLLSAAQVEKWIASVYLTFKKDETDKLDSWPLSDFYWNRQSTTAGTEPRTMCVCAFVPVWRIKSHHVNFTWNHYENCNYASPPRHWNWNVNSTEAQPCGKLNISLALWMRCQHVIWFMCAAPSMWWFQKATQIKINNQDSPNW